MAYVTYEHPTETESVTFWEEDGIYWNADIVDGDDEVLIYGRKYLEGGGREIEWLVKTTEEYLESFLEILETQAGDDLTTPRTSSPLARTRGKAKAGAVIPWPGMAAHANQYLGGVEISAAGPSKVKVSFTVALPGHGGGSGAPGGTTDPIKSIKGQGPERVAEPESCSEGQGQAAQCSLDLTSEYPRIPE